VILFLCSEAARDIIGALLPVVGGVQRDRAIAPEAIRSWLRIARPLQARGVAVIA
jgi:hypothetical protein